MVLPHTTALALSTIGILHDHMNETCTTHTSSSYSILDPSCNKYCDLIGQEEVSISHRKPCTSHRKPCTVHRKPCFVVLWA